VIILRAVEIFVGSPAASINIPPPIISIKSAKGGVILKKINSRTLSISTKKWQRVQGQQGLPHGTIPWLVLRDSPGQQFCTNSPLGQLSFSVHWASAGKIIKNKRIIEKALIAKNFVFLFIVFG